MGDSDDEEYITYGTALHDEIAVRTGSYRAAGGTSVAQDTGAVRNLPVWKQEVVDEAGRKRFHGAFEGGFSAGFYNTVGSVEGFQPASFQSSRSSRAAVKAQGVDDFLDEDEKVEKAKAVVVVKGDYDTFGVQARQAAVAQAGAESLSRPSAIPGPVPEELVVAASYSIGLQLLSKMGWRQGRGIGVTTAGREGMGGSRFGSVGGVSLENTPIYVLQPKKDLHGLGFDPFEDAEEFRKHKHPRTDGNGGASSTAPGSQLSLLGAGNQQGKGSSSNNGAFGGAAAAAGGRPGTGAGGGKIAFGTGALEETDTLGYMEDYVDQEDSVPGMSNVFRGGLLGSQQGRLGGGAGGHEDREGAKKRQPERRLLTFNFELGSDESDDEDRFTAKRKGKQGPLALEGKKGPMLLLSSKQLKKDGAWIAGFMQATEPVKAAFYPAPVVPASFSERHVFPTSVTGVSAAKVQAPSPPEFPPPSDAALRREVDALAVQVARSGDLVEAIARKQAAAAGGKFQFLIHGGPTAGYYTWRLHKIKSALSNVADLVAAQAPPPRLPPHHHHNSGNVQQRKAPLTVDERMGLLGEKPLPSTAASAAAAAAARQGLAEAVELASGQQRSMLGHAGAVGSGGGSVAEGDRVRLQASLASSFVKAEVQEMDGASQGLIQYGLQRRNAPPVEGSAAAAAAAAFASRFTSGSTGDLSVLQPETAAGLDSGTLSAGGLSKPSSLPKPQQPQPVKPLYRPTRTAEEWRPEPLLCRRFNVPDPYQGQAQPLQMSKFKSDYIALPDTAAAAAAHRSGGGNPATDEYLPPPPPRFSAPAHDSGHEQHQHNGFSDDNLPPPPPRPQQAGLTSSLSMPPPPPRTSAWGPPVVNPHLQQAQQQQLPPPPIINAPPQDTSAKSMAAAFLQNLGLDLFGGGTPTQLPPQPSSFPHPTSELSTATAVPLQQAFPTASGGVPAPAHHIFGSSAAKTTAATAMSTAVSEAQAAMDKPLDLFKAIFDADDDSDSENEEEEEQAEELSKAGDESDRVGKTDLDQQQEAIGLGSAALSQAAAEEAGSSKHRPHVGARGLADALIRAQQMASAGVERARQTAQQQVDGSRMQDPNPADGGQDPMVHQRILDALKLLEERGLAVGSGSGKERKSKHKERKEQRKDRDAAGDERERKSHKRDRHQDEESGREGRERKGHKKDKLGKGEEDGQGNRKESKGQHQDRPKSGNDRKSKEGKESRRQRSSSSSRERGSGGEEEEQTGHDRKHRGGVKIDRKSSKKDGKHKKEKERKRDEERHVESGAGQARGNGAQTISANVSGSSMDEEDL